MKFLIIYLSKPPAGVSTLAVEWIEIPERKHIVYHTEVSTLAVEWIEIVSDDDIDFDQYRLHPRGGVD